MPLPPSLCPKELARKNSLLENARVTLKNEFIGLDAVIDQVINSASHWFLFPEL